jgi:hypothetical protein
MVAVADEYPASVRVASTPGGRREDEGRKQLTPTAIKLLISILSPSLRGEAAFAEIE